MERTPSAMKRHRQSEKRRLANRAKKSMIRTFTKKAVSAAEAGDHEAADKFEKVVQSLIDKAAKTNTFHKNTAARKKSRLAAQLERIQQASA